MAKTRTAMIETNSGLYLLVYVAALVKDPCEVPMAAGPGGSKHSNKLKLLITMPLAASNKSYV
jgi:hypothetical protein